MLSLALALERELHADPNLTVVRRLVVQTEHRRDLAALPGVAHGYVDGRGRWLLRLEPDAGLTEVANDAGRFGGSVRALPPRMSGRARTQREIEEARAEFGSAREEFLAWSKGQGHEPPSKALRARGMGGHMARLDTGLLGASAAPRAHAVALAQPPEVWVSVGPYNLDVFSAYGQGVPPVNGQVNDLAVSSFNPNRMYAASARGGVWRSDDAGLNWTPKTDHWDDLATTCVVTSPLVDNRVYVGTGDESTGFGLDLGVMYSSDGGVNWQAIGATQFEGTHINDLHASSVSANTVVVASGGYEQGVNDLYVTRDNGATWKRPISAVANWTDIDASLPINGVPAIYVVGKADSRTVVLYRSDDDAETFVPMDVPSPGDGDLPFIACSKVNKDVIYLHYDVSQRVWKNNGRGGTWVEITGDLVDTAGSDWAQEFHNHGIACVRRTTGVATVDAVIALNTSAYVTTAAASDGTAADTWKDFTRSYEDDALVHVDFHKVVPHPQDPLRFFMCQDGGVVSCFYEGAANTGVFTSLSKNLVAALVTRISVPQQPVNGLLAGMQDNGMGYVAGDFGNWDNVAFGDLGHSHINPSFPANQFVMPPLFGDTGDAKVPGYLIQTSDDWQTTEKLFVNTFGDRRRNNPPLAGHPVLGRYVYAATNYLYRYDRLLQTWESRLGGQMLDAEAEVRHLAVAASDPNWIYTVGKTGDVYRTEDGGASWKHCSEGVSGLPNDMLGHVSIDPTNPKRVLVGREQAGIGTHLYECADTTADPPVWVSRDGIISGQNLPKVPVRAIARHPAEPTKHWFVATDAGVFMTKDGGTTWADLTPVGTFPNVPVFDIKIQASTNRIFVCTYGRGVWHRSLPRIVTTVKNDIG